MDHKKAEKVFPWIHWVAVVIAIHDDIDASALGRRKNAFTQTLHHGQDVTEGQFFFSKVHLVFFSEKMASSWQRKEAEATPQKQLPMPTTPMT